MMLRLLYVHIFAAHSFFIHMISKSGGQIRFHYTVLRPLNAPDSKSVPENMFQTHPGTFEYNLK